MIKRVGVLAVQGAFAEHRDVLNKLGIASVEIRKKSDFLDQSIDGLILPGGESTVMRKLLNELDLFDKIKQAILSGLPTFGTCAGLILLAKTVTNDNNHCFNVMDITVRRNAYGRQLGSFQTLGNFAGVGEVPMTFIRAPYIESISETKGVEVLATVDGHIVAAKQNNMLVTSFHPELTRDVRIHQYWCQSA